MKFDNGIFKEQKEIVWNVPRIGIRETRTGEGSMILVGREVEKGVEKIIIPNQSVSRDHGYFEWDQLREELTYVDHSSNGTHILVWPRMDHLMFQQYILKDKNLRATPGEWFMFINGGMNGYVLRVLRIA